MPALGIRDTGNKGRQQQCLALDEHFTILNCKTFFKITFYWKLHCSGARDNHCRWVLKGEDVMEAKLILEDKMVSHYAKWLP